MSEQEQGPTPEQLAAWRERLRRNEGDRELAGLAQEAMPALLDEVARLWQERDRLLILLASESLGDTGAWQPLWERAMEMLGCAGVEWWTAYDRLHEEMVAQGRALVEKEGKG